MKKVIIFILFIILIVWFSSSGFAQDAIWFLSEPESELSLESTSPELISMESTSPESTSTESTGLESTSLESTSLESTDQESIRWELPFQYAQTSWPSIHRDGRNSNYLP
ncbi:MAG: hypothetical protein K6U11_14675, partial [bacterium]|nr:hypothetical protein [bacterium]